jgi:hypothetical protein
LPIEICASPSLDAKKTKKRKEKEKQTNWLPLVAISCRGVKKEDAELTIERVKKRKLKAKRKVLPLGAGKVEGKPIGQREREREARTKKIIEQAVMKISQILGNCLRELE